MALDLFRRCCGNSAANHALGGIHQNPGGFALSVANDAATVGIFGALVNVCGIQGGAVGPGGVSVNAGEGDRIFGGGLVQRVGRGELFCDPEILVPATSDDPFAGGCLRGSGLHLPGNFGFRGNAAEVEHFERGTETFHMSVGVNQAGDDGGTLGVDDAGGGVLKGLQVIADSCDSVVTNRDGGGPGILWVDRVNFSVFYE